jgi:hypothetical protein
LLKAQLVYPYELFRNLTQGRVQLSPKIEPRGVGGNCGFWPTPGNYPPTRKSFRYDLDNEILPDPLGARLDSEAVEKGFVNLS